MLPSSEVFASLYTKAAVEALIGEFYDETEKIIFCATTVENLVSGNPDEKKKAIDNIIGEWDQLIISIYPSPSPVMSTPPLKIANPAVFGTKSVDNEGFNHPTKICNVNSNNDKVNEIKLENKFAGLSNSSDEITDMESQDIHTEKANSIPKPPPIFIKIDNNFNNVISNLEKQLKLHS